MGSITDSCNHHCERCKYIVTYDHTDEECFSNLDKTIKRLSAQISSFEEQVRDLEKGSFEIWGFYEENFPFYSYKNQAHPDLGSRATPEEINHLVQQLKNEKFHRLALENKINNTSSSSEENK